MSGPREDGAKRIGLIADIGGAVSLVGYAIFAFLRSEKIINFAAAKEPLLIAVIASALAGVTLLFQGLLVYFSRLAQFQRRSPWWNLTLGAALILVAVGGWLAT